MISFKTSISNQIIFPIQLSELVLVLVVHPIDNLIDRFLGYIQMINTFLGFVLPFHQYNHEVHNMLVILNYHILLDQHMLFQMILLEVVLNRLFFFYAIFYAIFP